MRRFILITFFTFLLAACGRTPDTTSTTPIAETAVTATIAITSVPPHTPPANPTAVPTATPEATNAAQPTATALLSSPQQPETPTQATGSGIVIVDVDKVAEAVTLRNDTSETINLSGWRLVSVTGEEEHPISGVLAAGETKVFRNSDGNIWSDGDADPADLYNPEGAVVSRYADNDIE